MESSPLENGAFVPPHKVMGSSYIMEHQANAQMNHVNNEIKCRNIIDMKTFFWERFL